MCRAAALASLDRQRILDPAQKASPDRNLRRQRLVDWTLVRDLQQARTLLVAEYAGEFHVAVELIEQTLRRLALLAVNGVNPRMPEPNGYGVERPLLAARVHRHGDRHAGSQRGEQEIVRLRSRVGPAGRHRHVAQEPMSSDRDLLCESGGAAVDRDNTQFHQLTALSCCTQKRSRRMRFTILPAAF